MRCVAIIPARGGSKGIVRKNVRMLAGKHLIVYAIKAALQTILIDRVVVSTDDLEIGSIANQFGADVVWRPVELSGDTDSSESALLHALEHLKEVADYDPDITVLLQCTSPLVLSEDIDGTVQALLDEKADTALSVASFHYFLWQQNGEGDAVGINHDKGVRPLRQEKEPQFIETGAVYVMRTKGLKKKRHRFFGKTAMYIMPSERCLEIDEPIDFIIGEALMCSQKQK